MSEIKQLIKKITNFRNKRDWKQFHNPKDVALSLVLEVAEVLEFFQWKNDSEIKELIKTKKEEIGDELADVLYFLLLMSADFGIDIKKSKGKHNKYTEL